MEEDLNNYKDFYDYRVYIDGKVFSNKSNKYLKPDIVNGYHQYTLRINKKPVRYKAHQLVLKLWVGDYPEGLNSIDHLDGDKSNNHLNNLEYVSTKENNRRARINKQNNIPESNKSRWKDKNFRENTSKRISESLRRLKTFSGKNNPRFKYIVKKDGKEITRTDLSKIINKSQSYTDSLIKRAANGESLDIFQNNNIKVDKS